MKKNNNHKPIILGHRGAKSIAPENTLASFQTALEIGVDMLELDVHLSKDGELMVIHDPKLSRTTDGQGMVCDFDRETLQALNAAAKFSGEKSFGIQHIPTLQEVYDLVGDQAAINVEIKTKADGSRYAGIEEKVAALVKHNGKIDTSVISSFNFPTIEKIQKLAPSLQCHVIVSGGFFQQKAKEGKTEQDIVQEFVQRNYDLVAIEKSYLTNSLMALLNEAGIQEAVWIINDVDEMERYLAMGVDRLTSDDPHIIVPAFRAWCTQQ
jgi:glycerophosphoryl diester phosphodiesterase